MEIWCFFLSCIRVHEFCSWFPASWLTWLDLSHPHESLRWGFLFLSTSWLSPGSWDQLRGETSDGSSLWLFMSLVFRLSKLIHRYRICQSKVSIWCSFHIKLNKAFNLVCSITIFYKNIIHTIKILYKLLILRQVLIVNNIIHWKYYWHLKFPVRGNTF